MSDAPSAAEANQASAPPSARQPLTSGSWFRNIGLVVALVLLIIQVASLLFSYFGLQTSTALVAVTAVFVGRAVRTVLGASIPMAILAGVIAAVGTFTAGLLLLVLPTGQAMLAGAA